MYKKRIIIGILIFIFLVILSMWISGIIPKEIAIISATNYLNKNFPKLPLEYVDIEWSSSFGGYLIKFKDKNNQNYGFIMNNRFFPISLGQGLNGFQEMYRVEYEGILDINDFYNHSISSNYKPITDLPENYTKEDAKRDNCLLLGAMVYNENLYNQFFDKCNKKENGFIRVVQSNFEGDIFIIDVLYEAINNKIHIVKDDTRDKLLNSEDRTIKYMTFEKTGIWNYNNIQYWVAYNGNLTNVGNSNFIFDDSNLFIIATIK